jgi:hypothetical protein
MTIERQTVKIKPVTAGDYAVQGLGLLDQIRTQIVEIMHMTPNTGRLTIDSEYQK